MSTKYNKVKSLKGYVRTVKAKRKRRKIVLEKTVEASTKRYARSLGALTRKYVSTAHPSVPDDIIFFNNCLPVFIEFKRPGRKLTGNQARELYALTEMGFYVYAVNSEILGRIIIDAFSDISEGKTEPRALLRPSEAQWQAISKSEAPITF